MAATIQHIEVNGLKIPLIYEEDKRLPLATMQFTFTNAGSITDTDKPGLAKVSAKVMNEGTKALGSSAFAEALESKAIHISASTGAETFVVEVGSLTEHFDEALGYFEALLKDPNLTKEALDKVKTTTIGGLSRKENDFDYIASNELKAVLFEGSTLANPSSGTIESVKSIEIDDVKDFIEKNIISSKLIVVLGGSVDLEAVKKKIATIIKTLYKGKQTQVKHHTVVKEARDSVLKRETEQAYVYFGSPYNMKADDEDYYKSRVATYILGTGGFGSRLMEEIRVKRGLAYSAYARVNITKSSSYMTGYLQTKLESMDEAKETVKEVIAKFVKKGVTQEELEQTKKFLLGSEPLRVETMNQRLNRTFMEYYKGQELGHSAEELKKIQKLELKDLNDFIKKHTEVLNLSFAIVTK
ncbi:MAG: insulinase family protein [Helicobacteraceae bacterium]|nr:insulinase family protein [Candidatus Sulfurimonas ponti]MBL6973173.1 insulinase family protein [Sulfurimonas sp.]